MNIDVSRRVGRVMSTMIPSLTDQQHGTVIAAVLDAEDFDSLPSWIQERVKKAERAIGVSSVAISTPRD
jgi:hypothetical protein